MVIYLVEIKASGSMHAVCKHCGKKYVDILESIFPKAILLNPSTTVYLKQLCGVVALLSCVLKQPPSNLPVLPPGP